MKVLITGANGHLGRRLASRLVGGGDVVAAVRSERAKSTLLAHKDGERTAIVMVDYGDPDSLARAAEGCQAVVHLVGILKESAGNRYEDAHEGSSRALAEAVERAGVERVICVSILGSDPGSDNACLASRARAEEILLASPAASLILRVPMVLGEDDYASLALKKKAGRGMNVEFRAASLEQPIYAGDVTDALVNALERDATGILELAGPECLSRRALIERAARVQGLSTRVISLPLAPAMAMAGLLELSLSNPPVTRAMLGVLDHDDSIDPSEACKALGIQLTSLDDTLRSVMGSE